MLGAVLAIIVLSAAVVYNHQLRALVTHWVGSPEQTVPVQPLPPAAQADLRLAIVGDVGDGGDLEWRLASTMYVTGRSDPYDALVLLGDNVYPYGDPARLDEYVFQPFAAVLDTGADLYAIAGNHDALADDGGLAQLQALGMPGMWWSQRIGDVLLIGLDSNQAEDPGQLAWLEEQLATSDAPWKIVAIHRSAYSAGYQGSSADVREILAPVFARYGVQLVVSGHDHDYQRSMPVNGVTYVVSGGGAGTRRTGSERYTAYSASTMNFVDVNVYPDRLLLRAIDHELRMFDEHTITR